MDKVTYVKPNGMEVEISDEPANIKAAEDLGWKKKKAGLTDEEKAEKKAAADAKKAKAKAAADAKKAKAKAAADSK